MPQHRSYTILRLIALFKLVKAAMLIALGLGALTLRHDGSWLSVWIHALSADPHGKYVSELLAKVTSYSAGTLVLMGVGSMVYAGVFLVEGFGLLARKSWAESLTSIITASLIPLEIYELIEHPTIAKVLVIIVNVAVVIYLVWRLRREHHWPFKHSAAAPLPPP
jgi:uncharacterized membrane protein (DUF2068 family)